MMRHPVLLTRAFSISADQGTQLSEQADKAVAVRTSRDTKLLYVTVVY